MTIFDKLESEVQSYARSFPVEFEKADGANLITKDGKSYIDFLAGAGSLNYGHNHPVLQEALIEYISSGGITHGLDMHTSAKRKFLENLDKYILEPRDMDYVVQFPGPTGANAVEAAMKLARKVTGRTNIVCFTNGFHGVTLGALSTTGNQHHRGAAGVTLGGTTRMPFDGYLGEDIDTTEYLDKVLGDGSSGVDHPAAVIVEGIQGEGGLNAARIEWLQNLEAVCRKHEVLLILDDIQAGCGRSGSFFSFEDAGISPDIITLSKSLSGYGLPFAITLIKRDLDAWSPGEHNGTFRGNNHAFVTAAKALETFWADDAFLHHVNENAKILKSRLLEMTFKYGEGEINGRGRGLMQGLVFENGEIASKICKHCFENGLIIETSGADDEVVKCLPPLNIAPGILMQGLDILEEAVAAHFPVSLNRAAE
ncbi:MAG: diaminobutyrate--2-oxoglutarate transaminase [Sneathiella sp.]|nr:diaminobutyrate--2-oxoglutarate transaminase [Sneathiella sp.]